MLRYLKPIVNLSGLLLALIVLPVPVWSQLPHANIDLIKKWSEYEKEPDLAGEKIWVFVQGEMTELESTFSEMKARVTVKQGSVALIQTSLEKIGQLATHPAVERIEYHPQKGEVLNDTMVIKNRIIPVHDGDSPLLQPYSGKGVIVGIIDAGIDFDHPDFKNSDGSSRIAYLWDQNKPIAPSTPIEYGYGQECTAADIDNGTCGHDDQDYNSGFHGSHVTGIAAGNGSAIDKYKGGAPEADIVMVVYRSSTDFLSHVTNGIDYCFARANQMGKPCVINTSIGTSFGPRDAKDLPSRVVENLLSAKPGRAVSAAAGNFGNKIFHLGYDVTNELGFTWFKSHSVTDRVSFTLYADSSDFNGVSFAMGANNPANGFEDKGSTPFLNVVQSLNLHQTTTVDETYEIYKLGNFIGRVRIIGERFEDRYSLYFEITPDDPDWYWRLMTKGSGRFDLWTSEERTISSDMVFSGLPSQDQFPAITSYKTPDNSKTLVSGWTCSPKVITVGMYHNRQSYPDINGNIQFNPDESGSFYENSSRGPNRQGYQKPEVNGPGSYVISTAPLWYGNNMAQGGYHFRASGTSMSAPSVTGMVALYFEKYADANYDDVIRCLTTTAYEDQYTDPNLPNNRWGYGKPNALGMMQCKVGCMDTAAINFDPQATLNGGCEYPNDVVLLSEKNLRIFPVPSTGKVFIENELFKKSPFTINIYDIQGHLITTRQTTPASRVRLKMDLSAFPKGIYFVRILSANELIQISKIILH